MKLLDFVFESANNYSPSCHEYCYVLLQVHQYGTRQACKSDILLAFNNALQCEI